MKIFREFLQRNKNKIKLAGARSVLILALFLLPNVAFAMTQQEAQNEIDRLNAQNQSAQNQINQLQGQKRTLANEIAIFNAEIAQLQIQINYAQAQIDLTTNQIASINQQIKQAEEDLKVQQENLKNVMITMYEEGQVSNIELIVRSNNFSEFVDRNEYLMTMQLRAKETADKIVALKTELDKKREEIEAQKAKAEQLKSEALSQKSLSVIKKQQKDNLLSQTRGNESAYQSLVSSNNARMGVLHCIAIGGCQSVANGDLIAINTPLYYNQTSSPWNVYQYDTRCSDCTISNYGCLITSLAMYHGWNPITEAQRHNYSNGNMLGGYGQNVTGNWNAINNSLAQGRPVIFGLYLNSAGDTHFVLAKSTSGGKYYINDPYFSSGYAYSSSQIYKAVIPY